MITLPNVITLARLFAVPLAVWLILQREMALAFWLFVAAGVSDAVDGFIAKRFGARSHVGAVLDPVADKALLVSVYVTLGASGFLPSWLVILVVFRDVLIVGGVLTLYVLGQEPAIRPLFVSKANTAMQILLAAAVLLHAAYGVPSAGVVAALIWTVAATTLASGAAYVARWVRGGGAGG
ncbi:CDP-alcohol phosphatidyltransferase family protein [Elioraea sp. Yellowstone]|uniref:CDP-alcohol phosphatidyltransferase family protein n=1 Tax=Elioraea sp. Yellowstone TaxID=2592070 RepID=UPI00115076EE|nr:CDP-alcohol phosphatidyltransferase family protein [Elioraea sp. Yellowstone]TQF77184.1 CDP-alcohol phosphatidyltransferase family protein [Elioraea sp. Yellowstone]